jgi:hypothetical protein
MTNQIKDTRFDLNNTWNNGGNNPNNFNQGGFNQGGFNQGGFNQGGFNQGGFNQGYNQPDFKPVNNLEVKYDNMYNTAPKQNQNMNQGGAFHQQQPDMGYTVQRPVGVSTGGECCCRLI